MNKYLNIDHVSMTFNTDKGPLNVLNDVNLEVNKGEFISLIGHSGCGKSTVLNIVAGLLQATNGGVILEEKEVTDPGPDRAVVFQNHSLLPWLTVYDNVKLAVDRVFKKTKSKAERDEWVRHNLELVHMSHALDRKPDEISGKAVSANYWQGEAEGSAIVIIHGFLQTSSFPTVRRLAEALAESGHTVLTPTLSLNVDARAQSLPCEAMHLHNMPQDVSEIAFWVERLQTLSGKKTILIGHSIGSVQVVAYLDSAPVAPLDGAILISMTSFGKGPGAHETPEHAAAMQTKLDAGDDNLTPSALGFCQTYLTRPSDYLSYFEWSSKRLQAALTKSAVAAHIVIGTKDGRINLPWIRGLQQLGAKVHEVNGANHFFDQAHEFDLLDTIEAILE